MRSNADLQPCLSVVVPVFNEAATVAEIISVVSAQTPVQQLGVVDDVSTDKTWEKLQAASKAILAYCSVGMKSTGAKVRLCGRGWRKRMRPSSSFGTPICNLTPRRIAGCWCRFYWTKPMWCMVRGSSVRRCIAFCVSGIHWGTKF
ncbi:MAG: glycosyltransferase [Verrucomicrobiota bacterium]